MPPQLVCSCVSSSLCISLLIPPRLDWERIWWAPFPGLPQGPLETMDQDRDPEVVWTSVGCRSCHGVMFLMWHTIQVFVDSTPIGTYAFFHITGNCFFRGSTVFSITAKYWYMWNTDSCSMWYPLFTGMCVCMFVSDWTLLATPIYLQSWKFKHRFLLMVPKNGFFVFNHRLILTQSV